MDSILSWKSFTWSGVLFNICEQNYIPPFWPRSQRCNKLSRIVTKL